MRGKKWKTFVWVNKVQMEICKLEIKGYNTNIYSRHVQHELYNLLIHERGKVREKQVSWKPHQVI